MHSLTVYKFILIIYLHLKYNCDIHKILDGILCMYILICQYYLENNLTIRTYAASNQHNIVKHL